ncbi:Hydrophobin-1 [Cladobotryum mycophilum]|uniref:Hydrophobin-1 n=1 Tax=Cladobotryum mycophilum TaxID=491253 RepID=A0ABR0T3R1_9HYPO
MQFFAVAALFVAGALASPVAQIEARTDGPVCPPGLFSNPQCCATDVLGLISLDCHVPINPIRDARNFREVCAASGQQPRCCVAPVASQAVLCQPPVGAY